MTQPASIFSSISRFESKYTLFLWLRLLNLCQCSLNSVGLHPGGNVAFPAAAESAQPAMAASSLCRYGESWAVAVGRIAWSFVRPYVGGYVEPQFEWKIEDTGNFAPERAASCERTQESPRPQACPAQPSSPVRFRSRSQSVPDIVLPETVDATGGLHAVAASSRRASLSGISTFLKLQSQAKEPMKRSSSSTLSLLSQARARAKNARPKTESRRPNTSSLPTSPKTTSVTSALHAMERLTALSSQGIRRQWQALAKAMPSSTHLTQQRRVNPSSQPAHQLLQLGGQISEDDAESGYSDKIVV